MERNKNYVNLRGVITSDVVLEHSHGADNIYKFYITVPRKSGNTDVIPVHISSEVIIKKELDFMPGMYVQVKGEYRSRNCDDKLILYVWATNIINAEDMDLTADNNLVALEGYVCKTKAMRTTPKGKKILDILLATNRPNNKSSYIPCVIWGKNAEECEKNLKVGNKVKILGRVESRVYNKKQEDNSFIIKTAYEVSVKDIEVVE